VLALFYGGFFWLHLPLAVGMTILVVAWRLIFSA
jgi:hypothetical protein